MKKVYYAHHMWKYYTKIEDYKVSLIKKCLGIKTNVFNPSVDLPQNRPYSEIMPMCFDVIKQCDGLVFSSVNGVVGKGVVSEVELAKSLKLPIYYIFNNEVTECNPIFELTNDCNFLYATVKLEKLKTNTPEL
jgi:hypothetical protein